jgi:hypothetical protein
VADLEHLGTTVTNQNWIYEGIKSKLNSWNACKHSVQNPSLTLLAKKLKIKIQKTNSSFFSVGVKLGLSF